MKNILITSTFIMELINYVAFFMSIGDVQQQTVFIALALLMKAVRWDLQR